MIPSYPDAILFSSPPPSELRPLQASNMLLEIKRYIQNTYPYWNRSHVSRCDSVMAPHGLHSLYLLHITRCSIPSPSFCSFSVLAFSQGHDHIWLSNHDEGACWYPTEIYQNSTMLTHWGRWVLELAGGGGVMWDQNSPTLKYWVWDGE